jgi:hypothetical protein
LEKCLLRVHLSRQRRVLPVAKASKYERSGLYRRGCNSYPYILAWPLQPEEFQRWRYIRTKAQHAEQLDLLLPCISVIQRNTGGSQLEVLQLVEMEITESEIDEGYGWYRREVQTSSCCRLSGIPVVPNRLEERKVQDLLCYPFTTCCYSYLSLFG